MTNITHQACPFCDSSDAFSYDTDKGIFNCFSCGAKPTNKGVLCFDGTTLKDLGSEPKEDEISLDMYVPEEYRGITKEVLETHGVYFTNRSVKDTLAFEESRTKVNSVRVDYLKSLKPGDKLPTVHFRYENGEKHRELPKYLNVTGSLSSFYGQEDYPSGGEVITITEGEEDRLSVIQMCDTPCVSVPTANPSTGFWMNAKNFLGKFQKIILSIDNDAPGDLLADKFYKTFPGRVYRVQHGDLKDANDFLTSGKSGAFLTSWQNASLMKPENILSTGEDFIELYDETPDNEYFATGIEELDNKMLGIHKNALTTILAPTGIGKTEFMRYLEYICLTTTKYRVAFCHLEETKLRSILGLVSYDLKENLIRKDLVAKAEAEDRVKDSMRRIAKGERLLRFSLSTTLTVEEIVQEVRFLGSAMDVDYVFIEPVQDLITGETSEKESKLTDLTNQFKRLAEEINIGIVQIAHTNEYGEPKYCKSISQGSAYEVVLSRDPDASDPIEKNTTYVRVGKKNRTGGGSGPAGSMFFDLDSYTLKPNQKLQYVAPTNPSKTIPF